MTLFSTKKEKRSQNRRDALCFPLVEENDELSIIAGRKRNSNLFAWNCSIFQQRGTRMCRLSGIPTGSVASRGSMEEFHQQFGVYRGSGNSTGAEMTEECRGRRAAAFKATPERSCTRVGS